MLSRPKLTSLAEPPAHTPDEVDYAQRDFINLVAAIFLLLLAIVIAWTVRTVTDNEKHLRCVESGRRECLQIAAPPQGLRALR